MSFFHRRIQSKIKAFVNTNRLRENNNNNNKNTASCLQRPLDSSFTTFQLFTVSGGMCKILQEYPLFTKYIITRGPLVLYRSHECSGYVQISGYSGKQV